MYKLTKITDDVFEGNHPNLILEGMSWKGRYYEKPIVGKRFRFGTGKDHPRRHLFTSTVVSISDDGIFKTNNSTYKLEKIK